MVFVIGAENEVRYRRIGLIKPNNGHNLYYVLHTI